MFFFHGKPGTPFAVTAPRGGSAYVGSGHEGFPTPPTSAGLGSMLSSRSTAREPAPLLLDFILGPRMEEYLQRALLICRGYGGIRHTPDIRGPFRKMTRM